MKKTTIGNRVPAHLQFLPSISTVTYARRVNPTECPERRCWMEALPYESQVKCQP
ncbi:MAG: hypothetical protein WCB90_06940 [Methanosarcina sp.]